MATSCPGLSSIHRGVRRPFTPGAPQSLGLHCQKIKGPRIIDTKAATEKAAASDGLEPGYTQASPAALRSAFSKIDFEQVQGAVQHIICLKCSTFDAECQGLTAWNSAHFKIWGYVANEKRGR